MSKRLNASRAIQFTNEKEAIEYTAKLLNIKSPDDWFKVKGSDISLPQIKPFIKKYGSIHKLLQNTYKEKDWHPWLFDHLLAPEKFWKDDSNIRSFVKWFEKEKNMKKIEDWYNISIKDIKEKKGDGMVREMGLMRTLQKVYPEYDWKPWLFTVSPPGIWEKEETHKEYLKWIEKHFKITKLEDWYSIKIQDIRKLPGGVSFMLKYGDSLVRMLTNHFPKYDWKPWLFSKPPLHYWDDKENVKEYFRWLASLFKIKKLDDWYRIMDKDVLENSGAGVLNKYGSLRKLLPQLYPEHPWKMWKFDRISPFTFNQIDNLQEKLEFLEERLCIKEPEEWYEVTPVHLNVYKAAALISEKGLVQMADHLKLRYPNINWEQSKFHSSEPKTQKLLFRIVREILPNEDIKFDYQWEKEENGIEFDIYIPKQKLVLEYNGPQHYEATIYFGSSEQQKERDEVKRRFCANHGITLIEVGFWWKLDKESIRATIHQHRPDLVPEKGSGEPLSNHVPNEL